jgi:hypothetical protein
MGGDEEVGGEKYNEGIVVKRQPELKKFLAKPALVGLSRAGQDGFAWGLSHNKFREEEKVCLF